MKMWLKILTIILLTTVCIHEINAQAEQGSGFYTSVKSAFQEPRKVKELTVDCSVSEINILTEVVTSFKNLKWLSIRGSAKGVNWDLLFEKLALLENLKELELSYNELNKIPDGIANLKGLKKIVIRENENLDYSQLFLLLSKLPELEEVHLESNQIELLPREIVELTALKKLTIYNNEGLNFSKSINYLAKLPELKSLSLKLNRITDLPGNISKLRSLEQLDIAYNYLSELPDKIKKMDNLDQLNVEGNIIDNPMKELEKLKGLNLKKLTIDGNLSEEQVLMLNEMFPACDVKLTEDNIPVEPEESAGTVDSSDVKVLFKVEKPKKLNDETGIGKDKQELPFGIINIGKKPKKEPVKPEIVKIEILSDAYKYYGRIFANRIFQSDFDSSLFAERFFDFTYANGWKIPPRTEPEGFSLKRYKRGIKKQIWFRLPVDRSNYPELIAFSEMEWVYAGNLNTRDFNKAFINDKQWIDIRLYYNEPQKDFTILLKGRKKFVSLRAYPRYRDRNLPLENSQRTYARRFERYAQSLSRRANQFNHQVREEKEQFERLLAEWEENAWEDLKKYMSPVEKTMNKDEWIAYYNQVTSDEIEALNNSTANEGNLERSFQLLGFTVLNYNEIHHENEQTLVNIRYKDETMAEFFPYTVYLLDLSSKNAIRYYGKDGIAMLSFNPGHHYRMLAINGNGEIAILKQDESQKHPVISASRSIILHKMKDGPDVKTVKQALGLQFN